MSLDTREGIRKYIEREGISSVLNDTKWQRLFDQLEPLREVLDFQRFDLNDDPDKPNPWDGDIYHVFGLWQKIEKLNIRTDPQNVATLFRAMKDAGVPFTSSECGVCVWAYLRPGSNLQWFT